MIFNIYDSKSDYNISITFNKYRYMEILIEYTYNKQSMVNK